MGRKKKKSFKPFCYYCDRLFDDEGVLAQHQKAKHFKCSFCNRRLPTAQSLYTHTQYVHKEIMQTVPNAIAGRDSFEANIYGMSGVPQDIIDVKMKEQLGEEEVETQPDQSMKRTLPPEVPEEQTNAIPVLQQTPVVKKPRVDDLPPPPLLPPALNKPLLLIPPPLLPSRLPPLVLPSKPTPTPTAISIPVSDAILIYSDQTESMVTLIELFLMTTR